VQTVARAAALIYSDCVLTGVRQARLGRLALVVALALAATPCAARAATPPTSIVTIGDSYIAGEGGRWLGNSANVAGDRDGTDRACVFTLGQCTSYDDSRVYLDGTAANNCHRSDVAEVLSAQVPVDRRVNLACSGAVTTDVLRASEGGTMHHGEQPQADRLLTVARETRVRMIVVSIGGNDLGFEPIVTGCVYAYLRVKPPCSQAYAGAVSNAAIAQLAVKVGRVIDEIRAVMRAAGYAERDYRLVMQTYPMVMTRAANARYAEPDPRRAVDGCPLYDVDMDWANDVAAPRIGRAVRVAAARRRVEVLDLLHAFVGHEVCAKTTAANTPLLRPSPARAEWGRAVSPSTLVAGELQEVFHPNAYGHAALGRCLGELYAASRGSYACTGAAGRSPADMALTPLPRATLLGIAVLSRLAGGSSRAVQDRLRTALRRAPWSRKKRRVETRANPSA